MLRSRKFLVAKNFMDEWWGFDCHEFPSKIFCLTEPKNFVGEPFTFSFFMGVDKLYASECQVTIFYHKIFFSQCQHFS